MTSSKQRNDAARGYTDSDLAEVSDNPEWTEHELDTAKPLDAFMPELAAALRRSRGPQTCRDASRPCPASVDVTPPSSRGAEGEPGIHDSADAEGDDADSS